jgi:hypothetical protein
MIRSPRPIRPLEYIPAIIRFPDYNALPSVEGWGGRWVHWRTVLGPTQKESVRQIGVGPGKLARWERGERQPNRRICSAGIAIGEYGEDEKCEIPLRISKGE